MLLTELLSPAALLLLFSELATASIGPKFHYKDPKLQHAKLQYFPTNATDVQSIQTPQGVTNRYKELGEAGVYEMTSGVNSYSGYIDLAPNVHTFFCFFESRNKPTKDDVSLWLNGGPGSDLLIGLFQELGPCRITSDLESILNPYSWSEVSKLLFLSQLVGTGFSYQNVANGSVKPVARVFLSTTQAPATGTYPILDPVGLGTINTTDLVAMAA